MILLETLKFVNYVWASLLLKMKLSLKSKFSAGWFPSSSHFLFTQFSSLLNWLLFHPRIWKHDDFVHCSMRCGLSHLLSVCTLERLHPMYAECLCWFLMNWMFPHMLIMLIMLILDWLNVPTYVDYADSWLVEWEFCAISSPIALLHFNYSGSDLDLDSKSNSCKLCADDHDGDDASAADDHDHSDLDSKSNSCKLN